MAMVFGNRGPDSGTGVALHPRPGVGCDGGLRRLPPGRSGRGRRRRGPQHRSVGRLAGDRQAVVRRLLTAMTTLERHYRDLCDIEFTIERGRLWMLQTRVGKRTAGAAFRIAGPTGRRGPHHPDEALRRVTGAQLGQLMFPRFARAARRTGVGPRCRRLAGCRGRVAAFDSDRGTWAAARRRRRTRPPGDEPRRPARHAGSGGDPHHRGGKTSHAAVVARGMGRTCVCGVDSCRGPGGARAVTAEGRVVEEGDVLSLDGTTGVVYLGEVPVVASPVVRVLRGPSARPRRTTWCGGRPAAAARRRPSPARRSRECRHCRGRRARPAVRRRRASGCAGQSTCSSVSVASSSSGWCSPTTPRREAALEELLRLQREDFVGIFRAMAGCR